MHWSEDKALGAFIGSIVGDALGAPLEFGPPASTPDRLVEMTGGGSFGWKPGQCTDDTDLGMAVTQMYLTSRGYDQKVLVSNFLAWESTHPPDIGSWTRASFHEWKRTHPELLGQNSSHLNLRGTKHPIIDLWQRRGAQDAGNGSIMRCWPTILATPDRRDRLREAQYISEDSHPDPRCTAACRATIEAATEMIRGETHFKAFEVAKEVCSGAGTSSTLNLETLKAIVPAKTLPWHQWTNSGFVIGTVQSAFAAFMQATSFEQGLRSVINRGNDADSVGAVAGCLLGARFGLSTIPTRWTEKLNGRTPEGRSLNYGNFVGMALDLLDLRKSRRRSR